MHMFKKGSNIRLSSNFSSAEFDCHCTNKDCKDTVISKELVYRLQDIRDLFDESISISSGYRCKTHNKAVGGVKGSTHAKGQAADLQASDLKYLFKIIDLLYAENSIGTYDSFLHFDVREDEKRSTGRRW